MVFVNSRSDLRKRSNWSSLNVSSSELSSTERSSSGTLFIEMVFIGQLLSSEMVFVKIMFAEILRRIDLRRNSLCRNGLHTLRWWDCIILYPFDFVCKILCLKAREGPEAQLQLAEKPTVWHTSPSLACCVCGKLRSTRSGLWSPVLAHGTRPASANAFGFQKF